MFVLFLGLADTS